MEQFAITIQGKVNPGLIYGITKGTATPLLATEEWLFLDYSMTGFPIRQQINLRHIEQNRIRYNPEKDSCHVEVKWATDRAGKPLLTIPKAVKTICRVQFFPMTPVWVQELKIIDSWEYHPNQIILNCSF